MKLNVMFEVVPPSKTSSDKYKEKILNSIEDTVKNIREIDCINVPEIIEENWKGQPYYKNVEPNEFAFEIEKRTGKEVIVNKVVVHSNGEKGFREWLEKSRNIYEINNFIFVGPNNSVNSYPGIHVLKANEIASRLNVNVGNILIPSRENEAERMLEKTIAGATFFTTQLLFESKNINFAVKEYDKLCKKKGLKPAKVFMSFSPVQRKQDIEFFKWLGVEIPEEIEKSLLSKTEQISEKSIEIEKMIWNDIKNSARENNVSVPLGINIEEIFFHNLNYCAELVSKLNEK